MISYLLAGVVIFLIGFYCGLIWVTRLENKSISLSFSYKTLFIILFIIAILILSVMTIRYSNIGAKPTAESTGFQLPD